MFYKGAFSMKKTVDVAALIEKIKQAMERKEAEIKKCS
jgi:hypothetical protein